MGGASGVAESGRAGAAIERARRFIDAHVEHGGERPTLARLAEVAGMSAFHLQRKFRESVGVTPAVYLRMRRAERLRASLRMEPTVSRAVYDAGYGSGSRVYERDAPGLGMPPAAYRRGGAGWAIRYTIVGCELGRLLVAVTDRGVCAVTLGGDDGELERALRVEYPRAAIERVDDGADEWLATLVSDVAATLRAGSGAAAGAVPLDVRGTAFQWRVWRELQRIPVGETRTYGEVAAAIGEPRAARAVARACASNRAALVVPCHRVIRGDGLPGGYRWGVERKEALLELEREERQAG